MLRPHGKISYQHSDTDMEILEADINLLIENGADGFVFGALTHDRDIDIDRCQQIIELASGRPVTFHRYNESDFTQSDQTDPIRIRFQ